MPTMTRYAAGTPCWVDLMPKDPAAARAFYGELLGWTFEEGPPEAGRYTMCQLRGQNAAGLGGEPNEQFPAQWTTYIATDDLDRTLEAVREAGGSVVVEAMDVLDAGRMAVVSDPAGAVLGLWQGTGHLGASVANEPGSFAWNECNSRDLAASRAFLTRVFGYEVEEVPMGDGPAYCVLKLDGREVGGAMQMSETMPAEVPSHWTTYFSVSDTDAAVETVKRLGGQLVFGPEDTPYGRLAVVSDTGGATFSVISNPASS